MTSRHAGQRRRSHVESPRAHWLALARPLRSLHRHAGTLARSPCWRYITKLLLLSNVPTAAVPSSIRQATLSLRGNARPPSISEPHELVSRSRREAASEAASAPGHASRGPAPRVRGRMPTGLVFVNTWFDLSHLHPRRSGPRDPSALHPPLQGRRARRAQLGGATCPLPVALPRIVTCFLCATTC